MASSPTPRGSGGELFHALGQTYLGLGLYDRAVRIFDRAGTVREEALGRDHPDTLQSRSNLALAYLRAGRTNDSIKLQKETLARREAALGRSHPYTLNSRSNLAEAYEATGEQARAESLFRRNLELQEKRLGAEHPTVAGTIARLGLCLIRQRQYTQAEPLLRRCLAIYDKKLPDGWSRFNAMSVLGGSLPGRGKYAEAEPLLLRGYEGMKARERRIPVQDKTRLSDAGRRLGALYDAWGKPAEAAAWRVKLPTPDLPDDVFAH